jgi:vacuolar-type H+-ATPase subunit E/Vma4
VKPLGSVAALLGAIREDSDALLEQRHRELDDELARLVAEDPAALRVAPDRARRIAAARRSAHDRIAQENWRDTREVLEERERWIERVAADARKILTDRERGGEGPAELARLAREAIGHLPGEVFEIAVSEDSARRLDDGWCRDLAAACRKREVRIARDGTRPAAGCVARTIDGKVSFDNSLEARVKRVEPQWRAALAKLYDQ